MGLIFFLFTKNVKNVKCEKAGVFGGDAGTGTCPKSDFVKETLGQLHSEYTKGTVPFVLRPLGQKSAKISENLALFYINRW